MKDMDKDSLTPKLLKTAYEKSGKTLKEIERETEIADSSLSKVFNGKQYASITMLVKIGEAVGLTPKQVANTYKKDKISEIDAEIAEFV